MSMTRRIISGIVGLSFSLAPFVIVPARAQTAADAPEAFRDGARWCLLGDEFTHRGSYVTWCRAYLVTRFPGRVIELFNAGVTGDTPHRALERLPWDVAPLRPTHVGILFGAEFPDALGEEEAYLAGTRSLIGELRETGRTPWLIVPHVGRGDDPSADGGTIPALRQLGEALGVLVVQTDSVKDVAGSAASDQVRLARKILDAVQAPSEIAGLSIDLRTGRFVASNSTVDRVVRDETGLNFVWTAGALPMPWTREARAALAGEGAADEALNRELLQVVGLRPGQWSLSIDGERIREYSHVDLEAGVNLAREALTPQNRQSRDVFRLLELHDQLVADNLRTLAWVEHRLAAGEPRPLGTESMVARVSERLSSGGVSPDEREAFEHYAQRKLRQAQSVAAAARLLAQARRAAQPQPRIYLLRQVK